MSIYASIAGLGDLGDDEAVGAPWRYLGSHVLPAEEDPRDVQIGLAAVPGFITRDGRDDGPGDRRPWPWLRLSLDGTPADPAVVLNPAQARHLAGLLTDWADEADGTVAP